MVNNFFFYYRMARSKSRSRKSIRRLRKTTRRRRMRGGANQLVFPATVENASYESSLSSPSKMMLSQGNEYQSIHAGQHGGAVAVNLAPAPPGFTGVLENGLRGQAWLGPLDASMQAVQGMSDQSGGRRRGRKGSRRGRKGSRRGRKGSRRGRKGSRRMRGGATNYSKPSGSASGSASGVKKNNSKAMTQAVARKNNSGARKNNSGSRKNTPGAITASGTKGPSQGVMAITKAVAKKQGGGSAFSLSHAQEFGAPGMLLSPGQEAQALESMNPEWKLATNPSAFTPR